VKGEEQTEIISSLDTLVDEFPYASCAQRYILQVQIVADHFSIAAI
jgi:hypothetical protein